MNTNNNQPPHTIWSCEHIRDELEAWALGALQPGEVDAIDQHLATCMACRNEAEAWTQIAGMLPYSLPPVQPSAQVKHSLMQRIADDQLAANPPSASPSLAGGGTTPMPATGQVDQRSHWSQLLIAPLAIALVVMTVWAFQLQDQLDDDQRTSVDLGSAILPNGVQAFQMKPEPECEQCETTGRLLADPRQAEALMVAWNLEPGEVHEVWCEEGDGSKALVASLEVDDSGEVVQSLAFDQPISGYNRIYVLSQDGELVEVSVNDLIEPSSSPTDSEGMH